MPYDSPTPLDEAVPVPRGATARRLTWPYLPPELRHEIERRLGAEVVDATSQDGGFTPGFASVLTGADGSSLFVKAASRVAQAPTAASYAEEARKHQILGGAIPAPRLEWVRDDDGWVVLAFEAVRAQAPRRPWRPDELTRALDLAVAVAASTETVPDGLDLNPLVEDLPPLLTGWATVPETWPHRDEAVALTALFGSLPADRFVHSDLRDDNILLTDDGRALACDWNWPALGPVWLDAVVLLASAHGDGLDAEAFLGGCALTREADPEQVDAWLAALCGFMLGARTRPVPTNSPHLRTHAEWYAAATWSWLAQRRKWD
ncbi:phosphotransferase [Marmoricola sp. RAF53]|uniref:phosphotransferase n=1 Tax=Marmoricola sp. RAF53 TaxID=3233059 RepID=UPI003F9D40A9